MTISSLPPACCSGLGYRLYPRGLKHPVRDGCALTSLSCRVRRVMPPARRAREELRKRVNMSGWQDKAIIAVVSRLTPQKGVHLIKHAAYKVCRQMQYTPATWDTDQPCIPYVFINRGNVCEVVCVQHRQQWRTDPGSFAQALCCCDDARLLWVHSLLCQPPVLQLVRCGCSPFGKGQDSTRLSVYFVFATTHGLSATQRGTPDRWPLCACCAAGYRARLPVRPPGLSTRPQGAGRV